tara:strand:- start:2477 stop:2749 length:273 start_codon:yes stop_codon:yes gene_type:complete
MNTAQELRDIKNILMDINKDSDFDSSIEYLEKNENVFQTVDDEFQKKITIDISKETFMFLATEAHEKDMKINDFIVNIITEFLEKTQTYK